MPRLAFFVALVLVGAACSDSADTTTTRAVPEATTATSQPPATTQPQATTEAAATTTVEVAPTTTPAGPSEEQLAAAAAVGDIAAGEELYNEKIEEAPDSVSCSSCHSLDGAESPFGPTHAGISAVAADRVAGMSDVDYLRESIVDPSAFRVDGEWSFAMPHQYPDLLSEDQINNLIAFLLTQ